MSLTGGATSDPPSPQCLSFENRFRYDSPLDVKTENEHRQEICEVGRLLHQKNYVAASDGNISVRLPGGDLLATPTGVSKGMMRPDDLVVVDAEGHLLRGRRKASSELGMHLLVYRRRPDVHAVVHAHPPVATGYAAAGLPLNKALVSEIVMALGCVPLATYGTPGTPELTEALKEFVPRYDALLMANHGAVTYGEDLLRAYFRMEMVEHFARISLVTELLGRQVLLSGADVEKLMQARQRYFDLESYTPARPGCPVVAGSPAPPGCPLVAGLPAPPGARPPEASPAAPPQRFYVTREELAALVEDLIRSRIKK